MDSELRETVLPLHAGRPETGSHFLFINICSKSDINAFCPSNFSRRYLFIRSKNQKEVMLSTELVTALSSWELSVHDSEPPATAKLESQCWPCSYSFIFFLSHRPKAALKPIATEKLGEFRRQSIYLCLYLSHLGLPSGASGYEPTCQRRRLERRWVQSWVGQAPFQDSRLENPMELPCGP